MRGEGKDRALVLSGGGPVGIAWELGLAAGLKQQGVDLGRAELIVGTSAGSVVGSLIALGRDLDAELERFRSRMTDVSSDMTERATSMGDRLGKMMTVLQKAYTSEAPEQERLAEVGAFALETETTSEDRFVSSFDYTVDERGWPDRFACTAIDAADGTFHVWDADAGVPHMRAVASSCAVPGVFPTIEIGGRRYFDGGIRSITNADLAAGAGRVLVVTIVSIPAGSTDPRAVRVRARREAEDKAIIDAGGTPLTVAPDEDARATIGVNLMDPSAAPAAAVAGVEQAARVADTVRDFWQ
jgi:NTE family protein